MHEEQIQSPAVIKLKDLIGCMWEDVHLVHTDIDNNPTTISELSMDVFTEEGKTVWTDVLNADVVRVFHGIYGTQIELYNVNPQRLDQFSSMLAGYCPTSDYDLWVNDPDIGIDNTMTQIQQ